MITQMVAVSRGWIVLYSAAPDTDGYTVTKSDTTPMQSSSCVVNYTWFPVSRCSQWCSSRSVKPWWLMPPCPMSSPTARSADHPRPQGSTLPGLVGYSLQARHQDTECFLKLASWPVGPSSDAPGSTSASVKDGRLQSCTRLKAPPTENMPRTGLQLL